MEAEGILKASITVALRNPAATTIMRRVRINERISEPGFPAGAFLSPGSRVLFEGGVPAEEVLFCSGVLIIFCLWNFLSKESSRGFELRSLLGSI